MKVTLSAALHLKSYENPLCQAFSLRFMPTKDRSFQDITYFRNTSSGLAFDVGFSLTIKTG